MTLKSLKNNTKNTKNFASSSPSPCPRPQHFDTGGRIRPSFQLALALGVAQVTCALPSASALGPSPAPHLTIANIFTIGYRISKCPRALCPVPLPLPLHMSMDRALSFTNANVCMDRDIATTPVHDLCNIDRDCNTIAKAKAQGPVTGKGTGHRAMSQGHVTGPCDL